MLMEGVFTMPNQNENLGNYYIDRYDIVQEKSREESNYLTDQFFFLNLSWNLLKPT